jgi:hypothetical protein
VLLTTEVRPPLVGNQPNIGHAVLTCSFPFWSSVGCERRTDSHARHRDRFVSRDHCSFVSRDHCSTHGLIKQTAKSNSPHKKNVRYIPKEGRTVQEQESAKYTEVH